MKEAIERLGGVEAQLLDHPADLAAVFASREIPLPPTVRDSEHPVLRALSRDRFEKEHDGVEVPQAWYGYMLQELFEQTVEEQLMAPTFITHYPVAVSPLAKPDPANPGFTQRFELFIGGMEIANGFSELNDPDQQAERFRQQLAARDEGDEEAHRFDADYVRALEHGMPPAGGEGVGIDRLAMLFSGAPSIRDVILFPLLRPEAGNEGS
jgi:lysyl-tRNA synthetase class 2